MLLKPQYSLLTLLVLTALVAGGVKLWRGPHRVSFSDPPTPAQELLLKPFRQAGYDVFLIQNELTFRYEVEQLREWNGDRVLSIKFIPVQELSLAGGERISAIFEQINLKGKLLVTPALLRELDPEQKKELLTCASERVICLLHRGSYAWPNPLYALTEQKNIYELVGVGVFLALAGKPETLDQVDDTNLRAKITTELANIPDAP
jgi:hypothetical protein